MTPFTVQESTVSTALDYRRQTQSPAFPRYFSKTMDFNKWNTFWSFSFGLIAFIIIVGNSLAVFILLKRTLRKRPHFLLISLAIADLLVGLLAIPIYMITVIYQQRLISTLVFDCVDMFTGFASVFTIAVISLERMFAVAAPLHHRQLAPRSYMVAIATPWVLSIIVTSTRVLLGFSILKIHQFIFVIITSLSTPLLLSCVAYCVIWRKQNCRRFRARRDTRLSKTVCLITGSFFATWLPFQVLVIVVILCSPCRNISFAVVFVIKLLQFSNSVLNFLIYCFKMPKFRKVLAEMFTSRKLCARERHRGVVHAATYHSSVSLVSFSASTLTLHSTHR